TLDDVVVELLDEVLELLVEVLVVLSELELELDVLVLVVLAAPQTTSACAVEMNRSAICAPSTLSTVACSAVTVISPMLPATVLDCSLITIWPSPSGSGTT